MNKAELAKRMCGRGIFSTPEMNARTIDSMIDVIRECLQSGEDVSLPGLMKIEIIDVPARDRMNLSTGEVEAYGPSRKLKCRLSQTLKDLVKNEKD